MSDEEPEEDEGDEEFEPSEGEEEEEAAAAARPTPATRRRSAPARDRAAPAAAAAAAAGPARRAPTRAKSSGGAAAAASSSAAAAAPSRKRATPAKRKGKAHVSDDSDTSEEDEDEDDSEEEGDGGQASSTSSESDEEEEEGAAAAGKSKRRKSHEKGKGVACGGGRRRRKKDKGHVPEDGERAVSHPGDESLLAHFRRLRSLYEAPQGCFDEVFQRHAADGKKKESKKSAYAENSSAAAAAGMAAAAAVAEEGPSCPDFVPRLPHSVSQHILSFLSPIAVARCERVSRGWSAVAQSPLLWKQLTMTFFPLLARSKEAELRKQESDVDPSALRPREQESATFFHTPNPEGMTAWAARRSEGRAVPVFDPYATAPLGTIPEPEQSVDALLQPAQGQFHWKHSCVNRLASTCVECRSLVATVYKLTGTRVCIPCAMQHPEGKYDVVNSGCAKGKFLLHERELAALPSVTEWDYNDDHKAVFFMSRMVAALRDAKYGGAHNFAKIWAERVAAAHVRLAQRREKGQTKKTRIPVVYRDNVGSTPEKTKGFFLCGRHNLATLFEKTPPVRIYPDASLE